MAISTYNELKTAVANWINRSDLTDRIPEFIALAEANIARDVRARFMEKRVTATVESQYEELPSDLIELRNIQINSDPIQRLEYMLPEAIDAHVTGTGKPKYYTVLGTELQLAPTPDAEYTVEIAYYARPTAFSADADTNDLLTNYPGLYLYGALLAAEPFLHNDERLATWSALYQREVESINRTDRRARFSGSQLFVRSDSETP